MEQMLYSFAACLPPGPDQEGGGGHTAAETGVPTCRSYI